jgi:hypothetical protein
MDGLSLATKHTQMTRMTLPAAALLLLAPVAAEATISRSVGFEEKVENAASIVVGKLVSQQSRWDDAKRNILTYSTFRIEKTLKGDPAQEVTIVTPGGTVGTTAQEFIGVPRFRDGEEHVLFVRQAQAGPTVAFLEQGDYRVEKGDRGDRMVTPAVSSSVLVDTGRGTAVAPEQPQTLRDFESAVRDSIRRRETKRMEMLELQKKEQASLWNLIRRNKVLVLLALMGAALATWQLVKRW